MRGAVRDKDKETKMKQGHIRSPEPSGASTWVLPQRRRSPPVGFGDGSAVAAVSSSDLNSRGARWKQRAVCHIFGADVRRSFFVLGRDSGQRRSQWLPLTWRRSFVT
ncbi:hypothetical protein MTO96_023355 [Rhipicephalus appendiculatus]